MKIGLIPMSAKPFHLGHYKLIKKAEAENDITLVFVSLSSRGVKRVKRKGVTSEVPEEGDTPIFGSDMAEIWNLYLIPHLDLDEGRVRILTPEMGVGVKPQLIQNVFVVCGALRDAFNEGLKTFTIPFAGEDAPVDDTSIKIYSDPTDLGTNFSDSQMEKHYDPLWTYGLEGKKPSIQGVAVERTSTVDVSGTKMRDLLRDPSGKAEFMRMMPPVPEDIKEEIYEILSQSASQGRPNRERKGGTVQSEALLRALIRSIL